jgi:hypothetical protein
MKTLSVEWQIAAHNLLRRLASLTPGASVPMLSEEARALLKLAEAEYEAQS